MRIDGTDVTQLQSQLGPLVEETHTHLDAIFHYFTPDEEPRTSFSDSRLHTAIASRVGRLLEIMVETAKWALWVDATQQAIDTHGHEATVQHVIDFISPMLGRRASGLTKAGQQYGTSAGLYWMLTCESMGQTMEICRRLQVADTRISTLVATVAPGLGMTEEGLRAELKNGNRDVARALAEQSLREMEAEFVAKGEPIPAGLRDMAMAAAGLAPAPSAPLDEETANIFSGMGIDSSMVNHLGNGAYSVDLPVSALAGLMGRRGGIGEDRIKVG